jgi:hypothetical protein
MTRCFYPAHDLNSRRNSAMLSQALFSVMLIAGCLVVYRVGIWKTPTKPPHQ